MNKFAWILVVLLLVGCREAENMMDIEAEAVLQATIPQEVVQQYGFLQLDSKFVDLDMTIEEDGSVTVRLTSQEVQQVNQHVQALFTQYEQAVTADKNRLVTNIKYDEFYKNIEFFVADEKVLDDESFALAEELLLKNALAYQLIHQEQLVVVIQYYDEQEQRILSKKTIPLQVSADN